MKKETRRIGFLGKLSATFETHKMVVASRKKGKKLPARYFFLKLSVLKVAMTPVCQFSQLLIKRCEAVKGGGRKTEIYGSFGDDLLIEILLLRGFEKKKLLMLLELDQVDKFCAFICGIKSSLMNGSFWGERFGRKLSSKCFETHKKTNSIDKFAFEKGKIDDLKLFDFIKQKAFFFRLKRNKTFQIKQKNQQSFYTPR